MRHSLPRSKQRRHRLGTYRRPQARLRVDELEARTLLSVFYAPVQLRHAYGFDQVSFNNGTIPGDGRGETIAIVDAFFDPTIKTDIATFSSHFGLPQLDGVVHNGVADGTFTQLDLSHGRLSPSGDDWTVETALDVEWAHAIAPKANILLVEAASDGQDAVTGEPTDLLNAVQTAAGSSVAGHPVVAVSMSWGINEVPAETNWDSFFTTPGVTFFAASGDSGAGTIWPAVSPNVVAVGGTTLRLTSTNTISSEVGWGNGQFSFFFGGSGGGFSQFEALPSYQQNAGITTTYTQFGVRLNPDIAYDADPNTGVQVYDAAAGGWFGVGGTSAGTPQWAALTAIADQGRALTGGSALSSKQTLTTLYSNQSDLRDITQGQSTGTYDIVDQFGNVVGTINVVPKPGYDLVTGLGTPKATLIIPALAKSTASAAAVASPLHTLANPLPGPGNTGQAVKARASDIGTMNNSAANLADNLFIVQASLALANSFSAPVATAPALVLPVPPVVSPASIPTASSLATGHLLTPASGGDESAIDTMLLPVAPVGDSPSAPVDGSTKPEGTSAAPVDATPPQTLIPSGDVSGRTRDWVIPDPAGATLIIDSADDASAAQTGNASAMPQAAAAMLGAAFLLDSYWMGYSEDEWRKQQQAEEDRDR